MAENIEQNSGATETIANVPSKISSFQVLQGEQQTGPIANLTADWKDITCDEFGGECSLKDLLLLKEVVKDGEGNPKEKTYYSAIIGDGERTYLSTQFLFWRIANTMQLNKHIAFGWRFKQ